MQTAKLFASGKSQAVRLPKEFIFEGKEVGIAKFGKTVILYPKGDADDVFYSSLGKSSLRGLGVVRRAFFALQLEIKVQVIILQPLNPLSSKASRQFGDEYYQLTQKQHLLFV